MILRGLRIPEDYESGEGFDNQHADEADEADNVDPQPPILTLADNQWLDNAIGDDGDDELNIYVSPNPPSPPSSL